MKNPISFLIILLLPTFALAQDITGLWKGSMLNSETNQSLEYEILITKNKGRYTGYSHTWFIIDDKKYYGIKKVKARIARDGKVIIEDAELIENNYPIGPNKDVRQLNVLDIQSSNNESVLDGVFVTNTTKEFKQLTGRINVKRHVSYAQSDLVDYLNRTSPNSDLITVIK